MNETPRTLIKEIAKDTDENKKTTTTSSSLLPPRPPKVNRGGVGVTQLSEDETPRRTLTAIALGLPTVSTTSGNKSSSDENINRKKQKLSRPSSSTLATPKTLITDLLNVAKTVSEDKDSPSDDDFGPDDNLFPVEEEEEEVKGIQDDQEQSGGIVLIKKGRTKRLGTQIKQRGEARRPGEIPYNKITDVFSSFLKRLPKPNRATKDALYLAHSALASYLERSVKDYARLARLDDASTHNLTKVRLEHLLREQRLLNQPIGDEMRRLLDREDADIALGVPTSRARNERS